ncbi:PilZ domain-containing protein [bacterium]|nr:PilZ domain-containing protein [bacterium]
MSSDIAGYKIKPVWIKILAIVLILAPLGNIVFSFITVGVPNLMDPGAWVYWVRYIKPEVWALNAMLFLSGISLLWVRTWTHSLAAVSVGAVLIYNIITFKDSIFIGPVAIVTGIIASLIALIALYHKDFRKPYFQPRMRWWETSPRYRVDLPVEVVSSESSKKLSAVLLDISRSGLLLKVSDETDWRTGESLSVLLPKSQTFKAVVVRKQENGAFGLSFKNLSWTEGRDLKHFIRQLETDPRNFVR